ncbi:multiubiquitin domain-containing protein [Pontibacter virosus]|uniref:Multiubiquitin n=1 Tax=Pontibacter virosus TaxID=1765052 RepID=A0A2U1AWZ0_9BACT|nr:multiubiquitin domain-containing protein [Pontibacter virosus]PVY40871.1 multiubiquitin [Pontibacter virosus]
MNNTEQSKNDAPGQNKEYNIIVSGRPRTFKGKEISFNEVVMLAYGATPQNPNTAYTVTYKRGEGNKPEGSMDAGDVVKVKEGMIFNVSATNKS